MKTPKKAEKATQSELVIAKSKVDAADYCLSVKRAPKTVAGICRYICNCARTMTRAEFDKMMQYDGNMIKTFEERLHYRFGKTMVSPDFIGAVFKDPDYYEKMFTNG